MYDAIVIGAGPAGLQAALTLGRMHRSTLLLDSGEYRNGTVLHMHNMIGADGTAPAQLRATARAELSAYDDVDIRDAAAMSVSGAEDAFVVGISDGSGRGRRLILATGVADDLPDVPGLQDLWGTLAFSCPFCDGHEHAGRPIAILGAAPRAAHLIGLLGRIVGDVTVVPVGEMFADEDIQMLEAKGVRVSPAPVSSSRRSTEACASAPTTMSTWSTASSSRRDRCASGHRWSRSSTCRCSSPAASRSTSSDAPRSPGSSPRAISPTVRPFPARWHPCCWRPPPVSWPRFGIIQSLLAAEH